MICKCISTIFSAIIMWLTQMTVTQRKPFHKPRLCSFTRQFSTCLNSNSSNVIHWKEFHELTTRRFVVHAVPLCSYTAGVQRCPSGVSVWAPPFHSFYKNFTAGNSTVITYIHQTTRHLVIQCLSHATSCQPALRRNICLARMACHSNVARLQIFKFHSPVSHVAHIEIASAFQTKLTLCCVV